MAAVHAVTLATQALVDAVDHAVEALAAIERARHQFELAVEAAGDEEEIATRPASAIISASFMFREPSVQAGRSCYFEAADFAEEAREFAAFVEQLTSGAPVGAA